MHNDNYEYCPRCDANLTLQRGYSNTLPFWECKGCGEMLINPQVDADDDIAWICDGCGKMLNIQPGFSNKCGEWKCILCGTSNRIDESEVFLSGDEYEQELKNPYRGMSNDDLIGLYDYEEIQPINGREDVMLVRDSDDNLYVKKILRIYKADIYRYIMKNPISHMPKIVGVYESARSLVVIEEFIDGVTLAEYLEQETFDQDTAIYIAACICRILMDLHGGKHEIVHRDIKPSNIMIADGKIYLIDINAAKWYAPDQVEDTQLLGTQYYAAPEQFGYGFSASSGKSDIYSLGVLLNVMITGEFPKVKKAEGAVWDIIMRCISMEPEQRYTAEELFVALMRLRG